MRWIKPSKLPVLVAWMAFILVIGWLVANPRYISPYASRMVGRHLLGMTEGGLQVRDFRVRVFEGMDLYGVSLTLPSQSGGMTLASADTVMVDFRIQEVLRAVPLVRRVVISRPEIYSRAGQRLEVPPDQAEEMPAELPRVEIQLLSISEASFEFSGSDGRVVEEISHLDWSGSLRSERQLELVLHSCNVHWDSHASVLEDLRGQVALDRTRVQVYPLFGTLNGHDVHVTGSRTWAGDLDLSVIGKGVSIGEIEDLIDMRIGFRAAGDVTGEITSSGDTIFYEGLFSGDLEGYRVSDLRGRAVIAPEDVQLRGLSGTINGAGFEGRGQFDISRSDSVAFTLEGDVWDVDLAKGLVLGEDEMPVTDGRGRLRIEHTDLPMWTRVTGVLHDGFIEIIPFDTCYVDVEAIPDYVQFNQVEVFYKDLHAVLAGASDSTKVFTGSVSAASENMATLPGQWEWPDLTGRFTGQGQLAGPIEDMEFRGWVSVYDHTLGPLRAGRSEAALNVQDVLEDPIISADLDGQELTLGGVPFGRYSLRGTASSTSAVVDTFHAGFGDTSVTFTMHAAFSESLQHFSLDRYGFVLEGTEWSIADPVEFVVGEGVFRLPHMLLESDQGAMVLEADYEAGKAVAGNLILEHFDLGLLDPFVASEQPLTGTISADVMVGGSPDDPVVNLTGNLAGSSFPLARVDSMHVAASFSQGTVDFRELDLRTEFGQLTGEGLVSHPGAGVEEFWNGAELELDLTVLKGDWGFLEQFRIPALDRLDGDFDGRIQVSGSTDDPHIEGRLTSAPFHVHWLHLDRLDGTIWADRDALVLADLKGNKGDLTMSGRIEVPMELDFLSEPVTPLDEPFYMQLDIPPGSDLGPLWEATNAFVQSSGTGEGHVIVSGPLGHPYYQGNIRISGAGFVLRDLEEIYHDTSCEGVFRGDVLTVSNIRGKEGLRGSFTGEGQVVFKGLELESFDIRLDTERFLLASIPDLRAVVNSRDARITSAYVGPDSLLVPKFSGNFEVIKGRYTGDFKEKEGAVDPMAATVAPDWLADLKLHGAPRTARIINREMELYLGGDLDLVRDEAGMYMRGALDVNSGRLIVFNNSFKVQRGRLDLSRELGFNPQIDLDATTTYRMRSQYSSNSIIENIGVHVGGTILNPEISFSSDRGYSREAIQRMLLGLEPFATPEGDSERLANTSISAGFNVLEREIAREIEIFDTFEIDQIQRQRDTGAELDPLIGVGKYIGNDFYLKFAQGIRQDDRDILVEYQINEHLLLQSEVRRRIDENQGNETYNLDLKYRFEY
jgi:hypothetical protein